MVAISSPTDTVRPLVPSRPTLRVWVDGLLYADVSDATVSVTDHGLVVGDGVFEALKVTTSGPFAVSRHLQRLARSARALGLPDPDLEMIAAGIKAVVAGRSYAYGKVRITYTGGPGPLGSHRPYGPPTAIVAAEAADSPPVSACLATSPWTRNEHGALTGVKSTSYGENVRALADAAARGASESIFLNTAGQVCEGTGSNLFCVFGSEIVTPPLSAGPLAGITRQLLLEWCPITERDLTLAEAREADEVFVTSSLRDVQPVARWDDVVFEAPGPQTARVSQIFAERSAADLDP